MKRIILTGALAVGGGARRRRRPPMRRGTSARSGCAGRRAARPADAPALGDAAVRDGHVDGRRPGGRAPPLLPYYRLRILPRYEMPDGETFYIPGANVICTDGGCIAACGTGLVPGAVGGGRERRRLHAAHQLGHGRRTTAVPTARPYAVLFNQRPAASPSNTVWKQPRLLRIEVGSHALTPWSLGGASWMAYYPRYHVLSRDGALVPRRRRPSTGSSGAAGHGGATADGHGWTIAAAAVVALAAAAGGGPAGCGGRGPADPWPGTTMPGSATTNVTSTPCFGPTTPRSCATWRCGSARATTPPTSRRRSSWRPGAASRGCATEAARCSRGSTGSPPTWRATG